MYIPFPPPEKPKFTFIDLFAGIGGFRIALQALGGKCVFSSEIDPAAQKTYKINFGECPSGDIREFTKIEISDEQLNELIRPFRKFEKQAVSDLEIVGAQTRTDEVIRARDSY